jgi:DNA repair exonuclease SbcCD ATPase subunit
VTRSKTLIKEKGLELIAPDVQRVKDVKGAIKNAETVLTELAKETRQPLTDWEDAEKVRKEEEAKVEAKRIADIRVKMGSFSILVIANNGKSSADIADTINLMESNEISEEDYGEFCEQAILARDGAVKNLTIMRDQAKKLEDLEAQAKVDKLAREEEDAKRKEEEEKRNAEAKKERERLAKEAEELKKREDELALREAALKKKEVEPAPEKAPEITSKAKDIPVIPIYVPRKADPKEETLTALSIAIGEECAEMALDLIIAGDIPHVTFGE